MTVDQASEIRTFLWRAFRAPSMSISDLLGLKVKSKGLIEAAQMGQSLFF